MWLEMSVEFGQVNLGHLSHFHYAGNVCEIITSFQNVSSKHTLHDTLLHQSLNSYTNRVSKLANTNYKNKLLLKGFALFSFL